MQMKARNYQGFFRNPSSRICFLASRMAPMAETQDHDHETSEPSPKIPKLHHDYVWDDPIPDIPPFFRVKKLSEKAILPSRASHLSAGYDLSSAADTTVPARGKALVPTDLSIAIPEGTYARIAPRSGLTWKRSIDVGAGVIDADYRGPVGVILFNHSDVDFEVKIGDRIAQLIIQKIIAPEARTSESRTHISLTNPDIDGDFEIRSCSIQQRTKRKNKAKVTEDGVNVKWEQMLQYQKEKLALKETEIKQKEIELKQRDYEILMKNTSGMTEAQLYWYMKIAEEIIERRSLK